MIIVKNFKSYDQTRMGKIEKNDFLQIVSIKNHYYLKFYADSNAIFFKFQPIYFEI